MKPVNIAILKIVGESLAGSSPARPTWKVKQIGDCSALEKRRGVKALGGSTPPPSVGREVYFFTRLL
jgi:hypothetical protein